MDNNLSRKPALRALNTISFSLLTSLLPISWAVASENSRSSAVAEVESADENRAPSVPEVILKSVAGSSVALEWRASKDDHTAESEITYQVYYAEGAPVELMKDLKLVEQGVGMTSYSTKDLPYSTKVYFYLAAIAYFYNCEHLFLRSVNTCTLPSSGSGYWTRSVHS